EKPIPIIGIECGHHETLSDVVPRAVEFFNALLFNRGFTSVKPRAWDDDDGVFYKYHVEGRLPLKYLVGNIELGDRIYPVKRVVNNEVPPSSNRAIVKVDGDAAIMPPAQMLAQPQLAADAYAIYQFREMEDIVAGQVVMMGVPSGNTFTSPDNLTLLFPTKSAEVYGEQPGMWPVIVDDIERASNAKFGYGIFTKERFVLPFKKD
ncbi:MAG: hypothetical protein EB060_10055, partial [Proteobacteria bacterium]|nr:hypothetical protein [Pseudomonadota bacterium]